MQLSISMSVNLLLALNVRLSAIVGKMCYIDDYINALVALNYELNVNKTIMYL